MRRWIAFLMLVAVAFALQALSGKNGYTPTEVFSWGDVRGSVVYPASFSGKKWADLRFSVLGPTRVNGGAWVRNDADDLFFVVNGDGYSGLIGMNGTTFTHLAQEQWDAGAGKDITSVWLTPITAGLLTVGHPIIVKTGVFGQEVVSIDPTTSPATETLVWAGGGAHDFAFGVDGTIYYVHASELQKLTYNAGTGGYDESTVPTSFVGGGRLTVGPDGFLYGFVEGSRDIGRIDPVGGGWSVFASVQSGLKVRDLAWDSNGKLWVAVQDDKRSRSYVTEVVPGRTTSFKNAITEGAPPNALAAGADGKLFVGLMPGRSGDGGLDAIHLLTPPADGGGGDPGGGGGNGGGKGKNK